MDGHRPGVTNFHHAGLVVEDLDETVRFLALLGFDCGEPRVLSGGNWVKRDSGNGRFMDQRVDGKPFKGVREVK